MTCLVSDANSPSRILLKVTPVSNKMCDALMDGSTVAIRELTLMVKMSFIKYDARPCYCFILTDDSHLSFSCDCRSMCSSHIDAD